jgi:hypothetical protein
MDLNKFAKEVTEEEGLKKSTNIAQVKEILRIVLTKLSKINLSELVNLFKKYQK